MSFEEWNNQFEPTTPEEETKGFDAWNQSLAVAEKPLDPNEAFDRAGEVWDMSVGLEVPLREIEENWDIFTVPKVVDPATSGVGTGEGGPYPLAKTLFMRPYLAIAEAAIPGARRGLLSLADAQLPEPEFTAPGGLAEQIEQAPWYKKLPEAGGWVAEKFMEYKTLAFLFKAVGLSSLFNTLGSKLASRIGGSELAKLGGKQALLKYGGWNTFRTRVLASVAKTAPENIAFIATWHSTEAARRGEPIGPAAAKGAIWGLGFSVAIPLVTEAAKAGISTATFEKIAIKLQAKFPKLADYLAGKPEQEFIDATIESLREEAVVAGIEVPSEITFSKLHPQAQNIVKGLARQYKRAWIKALQRDAATKRYWAAGVEKAKPTPTEAIAKPEQAPGAIKTTLKGKPAPITKVAAKEQNFTVFAREHGYTDDYSLIDHSELSPSGKRSKRAEAARLKRMDERFVSNRKGHEAYRKAILAGEIIDPSGKVTKEKLLAAQTEAGQKKVEGRLAQIRAQIDMLKATGQGKRGIKPSYQKQIDELEAEREQLTAKPVAPEVLEEYKSEKWAQEALKVKPAVEKKFYTSVPEEWREYKELADWGKKGLRTRGNVAVQAEGQRTRKSFAWRDEFEEIPTRLPKATMDAFKAKTDEIWHVSNRKGESYYLVPKQVVAEVREELGEEAFKRSPKPQRTPKQKINDAINSMKSQGGLSEAQIGENVLYFTEEYGLTEAELSDTQKRYIKEYRDEQKSGAISEDIQQGVRGEVRGRPQTQEEIEERLAIQEEHLAGEVGDFLEGIVEEGEPRQKDLIGRPVLKGGAVGEQAEFLEKEKYRLPEPDIEGQITFAEKTKAKKDKYMRAGFVDLSPLAEAGPQIRTIAEAATKATTRFTGLESEVQKVMIEYEEQLRELPKAIANESIEKFGKLTTEQERTLENHRENPKKYPDLPKELEPALKVLETDIEQAGRQLEKLGYAADWPNKYIQRIEKQLEKEQRRKEPQEDKIESLKAALVEAKDLQYLHHQYEQTAVGRRIWSRFKRSISKKPRGMLGRKIPTYEKAEEFGLKRVPLAVSHAHMMHELARAEMADQLIIAINENPNLSLPENIAPDEWVKLDERIFPASVQHQAWITKEGKPAHKRTYRKYPIPIAEALEELTYSRGGELLERWYDKTNFALKIIGFYNPLVMTKNDAVQLWRAAGIKGFVPLVLPQVELQTLSIDPPKAVQIWMEKGAEYEKLRKGGLFNNVISYTPAVKEVTQQMLNHIRETSGEKAARIAGEALNPINLIKNIRRFNDASTWNMDEIMRIATYEAIKDNPILAEMSEFEKIEWVNDALVNYGKFPKATKRWASKAIFVPTYRVGNFRFFWGEVNKIYHGQWQHIKPILRTVAYKMFVQWGLPAIVSAAILWKTGEERDVKTEKGYRLVIHNPETNTDTVYALSDPLLEGAKLTQRALRHTLALNLAPIPSLVIRVAGGPRFKKSKDKFGEFFKLGTPVYRDILNWQDPNKTVPQKILTQLAIAFVYTRRGREADKDTAIVALAKALSIWTDWKEQAADLRQMVTGRSYYLGPGGKFGRLLREFDMLQDIDRAEIDDKVDGLLARGSDFEAVKTMIETDRYQTQDGIAGRILSHRAPLFYYWDVMSNKQRAQFILWLSEEKKYSPQEINELQQSLDKSIQSVGRKKGEKE